MRTHKIWFTHPGFGFSPHRLEAIAGLSKLLYYGVYDAVMLMYHGIYDVTTFLNYKTPMLSVASLVLQKPA